MQLIQPIGIPASVPNLGVTNSDGLTVNNIIVSPFIVITRTLNALDLSQSVFVADAAYQLVSVKAVWGVVGGAASVLNIEKLTGTTAPGSGTALLTADIALTTTANTVNTGTLTSTTADLQLASGNRLGLKLGGVLTGLVGCAVTITLKRI